MPARCRAGKGTVSGRVHPGHTSRARLPLLTGSWAVPEQMLFSNVVLIKDGIKFCVLKL